MTQISTKYYLVIVMLVLLLTSFSECATHDKSLSLPPFKWDMSVENHTGISKNNYKLDGKHRGMSVFNWRQDIVESVNQLVKNNIECVALVPFLFQRTDTTKIIRPLRKSMGQWGHNDSIYMKVIREVHSRGMHVFYKPHLWMNEGWRSTIQLDTDEEWDRWFDSYEKHMLHYAILAELMEVEMYCIGTELKSSLRKQPERWITMIEKIKVLYKGKLTYAANWDGEYDDVQFWDQMDYIGIQAYYPLTDTESPGYQAINDGWKKHKNKLEKLSLEHGKKILFTKTGYRSDITATIKPWEWGSAQDTSLYTPSNEIQRLAYESFFNQLWAENWFAGVYFWQWHNNHSDEYKVNNMDFTPRYKPAENVMAKWYGKVSG